MFNEMFGTSFIGGSEAGEALARYIKNKALIEVQSKLGAMVRLMDKKTRTRLQKEAHRANAQQLVISLLNAGTGLRNPAARQTLLEMVGTYARETGLSLKAITRQLRDAKRREKEMPKAPEYALGEKLHELMKRQTGKK